MGASHRLDRPQRIGADGSIANDRSGRQIDRYPAGHIIVDAKLIDRPVETATAINKVIAAAAVKYLRLRQEGCCCPAVYRRTANHERS